MARRSCARRSCSSSSTPTTASAPNWRPTASAPTRARSSSRTAAAPRTAAGTGCAGARPWPPTSRSIYARATDIAELKRVESERERLLTEVAILARSDALTGLAEPARPRASSCRGKWRGCGGPDPTSAWRSSTSTASRPSTTLNGHQAGDVVAARMRDRLGRAAAWRRHDRPLRRRGVPRRSSRTARSERATEIVERLRAATPGEETCSAGLADWNHAESIDDLLDRADSALYRAKAAGRDRLVQAPRIES